MFVPTQTVEFQTKIKTTIQLQPLKYSLYSGNGKTILVKEMLLGTASKTGSISNTSHTSHQALVDRMLRLHFQ